MRAAAVPPTPLRAGGMTIMGGAEEAKGRELKVEG